jgi:hypothetical protein
MHQTDGSKSAGENFSLHPQQGEPCFQEAVEGVEYCDKIGHSGCKFYKDQLTTQKF